MILISCVIFICFESLQGDYESAMSHIQGGLRIIRDWQAEVSKPRPPRAASSFQHKQSVDSEVVQIFSRLNVQTLLFPDTRMFATDSLKQVINLVVDSMPSIFINLKEARDCLDKCTDYKFQVAAAIYFRRQGSKTDLGADQPRDSTDEHLLPQWSAAFHAFVGKSGLSASPKDLQGAILLEIQYRCTTILLSVGLPPRETAFDDFVPLFGSIIALAISVNHKSGSCRASERKGHFSFETSLVPPLYFTATRCRDPWIRRQALSLLSSTPQQECIWNSEIMSKIAERLILIEEERVSVGQVARSEVILARSRLSVLNATICSEKRQILVECCQWKDPDKEMTLLNDVIIY